MVFGEGVSIPGLLPGGADLDPTLEVLLKKHDEAFVPMERMYEEARIRLEKRFIGIRAAYYAKRCEIINKGVSEEGGDSGREASGGIEQFWLMCLKNNK